MRYLIGPKWSINNRNGAIEPIRDTIKSKATGIEKNMKEKNASNKPYSLAREGFCGTPFLN